MIINTNYRKGNNGWEGESRVPLIDNKVLYIKTMKRYNGAVTTTARVDVVEGGWGTHRVFHDFNATLAIHAIKRVTEKAIITAHTEMLEELGDFTNLRSTVTSHYEKHGEIA